MLKTNDHPAFNWQMRKIIWNLPSSTSTGNIYKLTSTSPTPIKRLEDIIIGNDTIYIINERTNKPVYELLTRLGGGSYGAAFASKKYNTKAEIVGNVVVKISAYPISESNNIGPYTMSNGTRYKVSDDDIKSIYSEFIFNHNIPCSDQNSAVICNYDLDAIVLWDNVFPIYSMEEMDGTLNSLIKKIEKDTTNYTDYQKTIIALYMVVKLIKCMHIIHDKNIWHLDCHLENWFYRWSDPYELSTLEIKLGDFGLACATGYAPYKSVLCRTNYILAYKKYHQQIEFLRFQESFLKIIIPLMRANLVSNRLGFFCDELQTQLDWVMKTKHTYFEDVKENKPPLKLDSIKFFGINPKTFNDMMKSNTIPLLSWAKNVINTLNPAETTNDNTYKRLVSDIDTKILTWYR
jgi:hypothetical protein